MLAGVGAVDACLFVVAATEGWKPQSEEHLRILELLGVRHGIVALTKVDLVDDEWCSCRDSRSTSASPAPFLAGAEIVAVQRATGAGLDELRAALDRLAGATPPAPDRGRPRLWVDRVVRRQGQRHGRHRHAHRRLAATDRRAVDVAGRHAVRVRALQTHGAPVDAQSARAPRGRSTSPASPTTSVGARRRRRRGRASGGRRAMVDASLHVLAALDHDVSRRGAYVAYIGSGEHPGAAAGARRRRRSPPGSDGLVRLHLAERRCRCCPATATCCARAGGPRRSAAARCSTSAPVLPASRARPDRAVERVVAERGRVDADELEPLTGERRRADRSVGG